MPTSLPLQGLDSIFAAADRQLDAAALKRPFEVPVPTRSAGPAELSDGCDDDNVDDATWRSYYRIAEI